MYIHILPVVEFVFIWRGVASRSQDIKTLRSTAVQSEMQYNAMPPRSPQSYDWYWLHGSLSEIEVAQRPRSISHITGFRSVVDFMVNLFQDLAARNY
eukprot:sb/3479064/